MYTSTTLVATLYTSLLTYKSIAYPTFIEERDHVSCNPQGQCSVVSACENNFQVVPGSNPDTPGTPPVTPIVLPQSNKKTVSSSSSSSAPRATPSAGTVSATSIESSLDSDSSDSLVTTPRRLLRARTWPKPATSANPAHEISSALKKRQVNNGAKKWCAIGTSVYLNLVPVTAATKVVPATLQAILAQANQTIDSTIEQNGDGPISDSAGSANGDAIFTVAPQGNSGDQFNVFQGTDGGITWSEAKLAVGLITDYCTKNGWGWIGAGVVDGVSQVGRVVLN